MLPFAEEKQLARMISDEVEQVILIIDQQNRVVMANAYTSTRLGLMHDDGYAKLASVFDVDDLYGFITSQSFNNQWQGVFSVRVGEDIAPLVAKAKYITGPKGVFNNLLIIGQLTLNDSTLPSLAENNLDISYGQFRKLYEISASINSNLDFQTICSDITMKVAELVGADRSLLYSVEDTQIGVFATWNMTPEEAAMFRLVDMEHGVIKNCLRNMAPVLVPVYSRHPDWIPEIYEELNRFESFILFPLLAQKQLVGVLALFGQEPAKFDDRTLMLLQMISSQMAIAVLNAQVYSEIRSLNKHLEEEVCLKVNELRVSELQLLRKSNEQEAIFNSITDSLVVVDSNLRIIDINQAALSYYGIKDKKHAVSKKYCDFICQRRYCKRNDTRECRPPDCSRGCCTDCLVCSTMASGKPSAAEADIADRVHLISVYPIFDEESRIQKAVCLLRDITLLKRRSGELVQSQKMQAVGQLAAGVAHEIRNPLGAISNYVYILENWLREIEENGFIVEADIKNAFSAIKKLVERSEHVIRSLLDFSREKPSEVSIFALQDVIEQILMLVGKTAQKKKVEIVVDGNPKLMVKSNSSAIQHILFNLMVNAIDALPDGGKVTMKYASSNGLQLIVIDNGEGIKKEDLEKIYNPFYTTKAPNRGTGLGLYIVYNLVKQLGGNISVESSPGIKTKFTVTLPQ